MQDSLPISKKITRIQNFYKDVLKIDLVGNPKIHDIENGLELLDKLLKSNNPLSVKFAEKLIDCFHDIVSVDFTGFRAICEKTYKINTYIMFWAFMMNPTEAIPELDVYFSAQGQAFQFSSYYQHHLCLGIISGLRIFGLTDNMVCYMYSHMYNAMMYIDDSLGVSKKGRGFVFLYYIPLDIIQHTFNAIIELFASVFYLSPFGIYKLIYHILHWISFFFVFFLNDVGFSFLFFFLKWSHYFEYLGHKYNPYCKDCCDPNPKITSDNL